MDKMLQPLQLQMHATHAIDSTALDSWVNCTAGKLESAAIRQIKQFQAKSRKSLPSFVSVYEAGDVSLLRLVAFTGDHFFGELKKKKPLIRFESRLCPISVTFFRILSGQSPSQIEFRDVEDLFEICQQAGAGLLMRGFVSHLDLVAIDKHPNASALATLALKFSLSEQPSWQHAFLPFAPGIGRVLRAGGAEATSLVDSLTSVVLVRHGVDVANVPAAAAKTAATHVPYAAASRARFMAGAENLHGRNGTSECKHRATLEIKHEAIEETFYERGVAELAAAGAGDNHNQGDAAPQVPPNSAASALLSIAGHLGDRECEVRLLLVILTVVACPGTCKFNDHSTAVAAQYEACLRAANISAAAAASLAAATAYVHARGCACQRRLAARMAATALQTAPGPLLDDDLLDELLEAPPRPLKRSSATAAAAEPGWRVFLGSAVLCPRGSRESRVFLILRGAAAKLYFNYSRAKRDFTLLFLGEQGTGQDWHVCVVPRRGEWRSRVDALLRTHPADWPQIEAHQSMTKYERDGDRTSIAFPWEECLHVVVVALHSTAVA